MDRGIGRWETFQVGQVKAGFGQLRGFPRAASAFEGGRGFSLSLLFHPSRVQEAALGRSLEGAIKGTVG